MDGGEKNERVGGFPFALLMLGYGAAFVVAAILAAFGFGLLTAFLAFVVGGAAAVVALGLSRRVVERLTREPQSRD